jgi:hypothetical protein
VLALKTGLGIPAECKISASANQAPGSWFAEKMVIVLTLCFGVRYPAVGICLSDFDTLSTGSTLLRGCKATRSMFVLLIFLHKSILTLLVRRCDIVPHMGHCQELYSVVWREMI